MIKFLIILAILAGLYYIGYNGYIYLSQQNPWTVILWTATGIVSFLGIKTGLVIWRYAYAD